MYLSFTLLMSCYSLLLEISTHRLLRIKACGQCVGITNESSIQSRALFEVMLNYLIGGMSDLLQGMRTRIFRNLG